MTRARGRGVRVIAGSARGRRLATPAGEQVRPTKDVVRESVFAALDARDAVVGAAVLDLFAGSGALAIEALSRGAARAVIVERDRAALRAIGENVHSLRLESRVHVVAGDAIRYVESPPPADAPFDLVFADPPYDTDDETVARVLAALGAAGWLATDGVAVVERPSRRPVVVPEGWRTGWERAFGDTLVYFCRR